MVLPPRTPVPVPPIVQLICVDADSKAASTPAVTSLILVVVSPLQLSLAFMPRIVHSTDQSGEILSLISVSTVSSSVFHGRPVAVTLVTLSQPLRNYPKTL